MIDVSPGEAQRRAVADVHVVVRDGAGDGRRVRAEHDQVGGLGGAGAGQRAAGERRERDEHGGETPGPSPRRSLQAVPPKNEEAHRRLPALWRTIGRRPPADQSPRGRIRDLGHETVGPKLRIQ